MKKCITIFFLFIGITSTIQANLGTIFDTLMGANTNPYFQACITNKIKEPWFPDSNFAYYFSRSLFEKYSIENGLSQIKLKIPKIIHQIWLGGFVPVKYVDWIATWHEHHPDWTIIMWMDEDIQNLNLVNKDLFLTAKNYGEKSDILRLELINMFGGLYVDTDYECLKPLDAFHYCNSFYVSSAGIGECGVGIVNALIGASPRHPLIGKLVHSMKAAAHMPMLSQRSGPMYFTKIFFENVEECSKDVVMYPADYLAAHGGISYATHWFDASWLNPSGLNQRILHDSRLEKTLTPLFFKKKSGGKYPRIFPKLYYDIWTGIFEQLKNRTIVELGVTNFIVDSRMDLGDLKYIGISPVKFLALQQRLFYNDHANRVYWWKNCLVEGIPQCGLLILGDCMEYLSYADCMTLLQKVAYCDPEIVIIAHNSAQNNSDTELGQQRSLNMGQAPFNLPNPDKIITIEKKTYGVWRNC